MGSLAVKDILLIPGTNPPSYPLLQLRDKPQSLWLINLSWLKLLFYFSTFVSSTFLCNLKVLCICVNLYGAVGTWWTRTGGNCHHLWRKSKSNWPQSKLRATQDFHWQMKPQYYSYRNKKAKLEKWFWKLLPVENTPFLDCVSLTSTPSWVYHCPSFLSYLTGSGVGVWGVNVNRSVLWKVEHINNPLNTILNKLRNAQNITVIGLWDFNTKK